jgi:hypothetical protein
MTVTGLRVGPFAIVEPTWVPDPGRWYLGRADSGDEALVRVAGGDDREDLLYQHQVLVALDDPRIPAVVAHDDRVGAFAIAPGTGTPLAEAIAQRMDESVVLTPATLIDVLREVALAVAHAQSRAIVHGHLDPDLILLTPGGEIALFGYGVTQPSPRAWRAPEISAGEPPTYATDVWSIGALGLGLVLGHAPFRTDEEAASGDCDPLVRMIASQWPALGRALGKAVARDPAARFAHATEMLTALNDLAAAAGPDTERATLAATLWARRSADLAPLEGGAATAVPATDADEAPPSMPPEPAPPALARPMPAPPPLPPVPTVVPKAMTSEDATLGEARAPAPAWSMPPIQRLAPLLAAAMVVLLVVWMLTRLF